MSALPIRMPCRFSVESDRPWTTAVPALVSVIQSPCRHTPDRQAGYGGSKYTSRYRDPSSSPQMPNGMEGIGFSTTSSPTSSRTGRPSSSHDSTAMPSPRHDICPAVTGSQGASHTSAAAKSVPPLMTCSAKSFATWS